MTSAQTFQAWCFFLAHDFQEKFYLFRLLRFCAYRFLVRSCWGNNDIWLKMPDCVRRAVTCAFQPEMQELWDCKDGLGINSLWREDTSVTCSIMWSILSGLSSTEPRYFKSSEQSCLFRVTWHVKMSQYSLWPQHLPHEKQSSRSTWQPDTYLHKLNHTDLKGQMSNVRQKNTDLMSNVRQKKTCRRHRQWWQKLWNWRSFWEHQWARNTLVSRPSGSVSFRLPPVRAGGGFELHYPLGVPDWNDLNLEFLRYEFVQSWTELSIVLCWLCAVQPPWKFTGLIWAPYTWIKYFIFDPQTWALSVIRKKLAILKTEVWSPKSNQTTQRLVLAHFVCDQV